MSAKFIRKNLKELFYLKNNLNWGLFVFSLGLLVGSSWIATSAANHFFDVPPFENIARSASFFSLIGSITWVPVIEEIIFRKYLVSLLQKVFPWKISAGISSIVFAILHGQKNFLPFLINGFIYSWIMKKSRTIVMPILLHMAYNLIAIKTQI
ncbi:CPBP family intramembrane glutamic endopeptidase [Enterococcus casseliflavus]|uniref:CPBP family intramembrane glutamic endopeptidase n=1 Tax=Enterococcus casseliflavus TaxID=37734 RepID=UPI000FF8B5F8|nr:CPBP family intramembrane metalloprotease [Enterococcus casseliflavus]RXA69159.1 CPBP family intramembrane metalloprotease [Enterococcus casseliflavus]